MANKTQTALEYVRRQLGIGSKEVARTPAKQGIKTSARNPTSIEGKAKNRQTKKRAAKADMAATPAKKAAAPTPTKERLMAKKEKVNKTKAVAAYLKTKPDATASEIVETMAKQKIKLTVAYASNLKSTIKAKLAERKAAKSPAAPVPAAAAPEPVVAEKPAKDMLTLEHVRAVAKTVKDIGGFARLDELLGVIKEVGGMKKFRDLMEAMAGPETDDIRF